MSKQTSPIDPAIAQYYHKAPEEDRLGQGAFILEEVRTRELIERYAPRPPATVLDVGGAAGAYALWLGDAGYTVHLVDAAPRLVAEAERRSEARAVRLASCRVGDARSLEFPDQSADFVLLLGPLYHLTDRAGRAGALREARRVLKAGGLLFAAAISRFASALDGLSRDLLQDPEFASIIERDLREGQHRNPTGRLEYFTTAYFQSGRIGSRAQRRVRSGGTGVVSLRCGCTAAGSPPATGPARGGAMDGGRAVPARNQRAPAGRRAEGVEDSATGSRSRK
jgi:ubiquinone/menaquinone biosynthesis C-methylase UbiE